MEWKNNIFIIEDDLEHSSPTDPWPAGRADCNILVAPSFDHPRPTLQGPNGASFTYDPVSLTTDIGFSQPTRADLLSTLDFTLSRSGFGVDRGVPVSVPGYTFPYVGLPDIGPFEQGVEPGPDWPRPRTTTFITTAGP